MNHAATDRTPYTYVIRSLDTGKRYYGVRFNKGCHPNDLWVAYFTSSRHVHADVKKYGKHRFTAEVRRVFDSKKKAWDWEEKVLIKLKVPNPNWYNLWTMSAKYRPPKPNLGHRHSVETKAKMSAIRKSMVGIKNPLYSKPKSAAAKLATSKALRGLKQHRKALMTCAICGKTGDTAMFILQHKNCTRRKFTHCAICAAPRRSPLYKDTTKNPAWVYHCASCRAKLRPKQMRSGPIHKEVTCPHCGKTGRGHAMRLWHFDKCKVLRQTPSTFANLPL